MECKRDSPLCSKEVRTDMNKGRIVQVMGPVIDVVFEDGNLPFIKDALEVENNGKKCIMEVAQHLSFGPIDPVLDAHPAKLGKRLLGIGRRSGAGCAETICQERVRV